ncbi:ParM/StbA family protein [Clostridium pasteurianum]|uniref:Actin-like protein N-terminal domain-containing protein n=1 Tax=Clostridium pasteurianum BC1 TaxID=86416 RepID=R4KAK0_CLOPA|nr:ParM/StbA family protein [Clostridium pasteurianum]AGK99588.1 hypothetical protein Clopa_4915 [Clostridium pasteurianum BC1]
MSSVVISLDPGKDTTKVMGVVLGNNLKLDGAKPKHFLSRMYDLTDGYIDVEGDDSHKVVFDEGEYIVGKQGGERKNFETSKENLLHKICSYVSITQYLQPGTKDNKVYLVLACPITVLSNEDAKQSYKSFIKGDGVIKINVDDNDFEFEIAEIMLKAEGSGVRYLTPELFTDKKVGVIDFGGQNMTFTLFTDGSCANPQKDRFAEDFLGAVQLINYVSDALTDHNKKGNRVNVNVAEEALDRGYGLDFGKKDETTVEYIKKAKIRFFDEACEQIARHGISLRDLDTVICVGGTTQHLTDEITDKLPNSMIATNSQFTTVEGLFKIAVKKYGKAI